MRLINEIFEAIDGGLDSFKNWVKKRKEADNHFVRNYIGLPNNTQINLINILIDVHQDNEHGHGDRSRNLVHFIDFLIMESDDVNIGEPLHQILATKKIQLALHLLDPGNQFEVSTKQIKSKLKECLKEPIKNEQPSVEKKKSTFFDVDKRDIYGRTLLYLVLNLKNTRLLAAILDKKPNIHATSLIPKINRPFQPLHQAIILDFADGVRLLASEGAQLSNPFGVLMDTPLLLAARLGKINALEALLECPIEALHLEEENRNYFIGEKIGHTAIEELCEHIEANGNKSKAIKGIAMLLCRGAELPRNQDMQQLLCENRVQLLKAVHRYLEDKPELVDSFVNRCHLAESPLHKIIYSDQSWSSSIRRLFGLPSEAAFMVEKLVVRKYSDRNLLNPDTKSLSPRAAETLNGEKDPLKLYAEFVRRYEETYNSQSITNRWSTMRWMIADGKCNWGIVEDYAKKHPASRTAIVFRDMFSPLPKLHEEIDSEVRLENVIN